MMQRKSMLVLLQIVVFCGLSRCADPGGWRRLESR